MERSRIKKPQQPLYSTQMSEYYLGPDLYVGAHVDFNSHQFILIDADEYAFRYMENNAGEVGTRVVLMQKSINVTKTFKKHCRNVELLNKIKNVW